MTQRVGRDQLYLYALARNKSQGFTLLTGSGSSTNPVDIIVVSIGLIKVNDVTDAGNIQPAGGHIGRNKHLDAAFFKGSQGALTLWLRLIAVDCFGRVAKR